VTTTGGASGAGSSKRTLVPEVTSNSVVSPSRPACHGCPYPASDAAETATVPDSSSVGRGVCLADFVPYALINKRSSALMEVPVPRSRSAH